MGGNALCSWREVPVPEWWTCRASPDGDKHGPALCACVANRKKSWYLHSKSFCLCLVLLFQPQSSLWYLRRILMQWHPSFSYCLDNGCTPSYQKGLCKLWEEFLTKGTITGPSLLSGHKKPLLSHKSGFPRDSVVKNPPANAGDLGSIPGSGRASSIPGGGNGNPLQYSCLENPMDRGAWRAIVHRVAESDTTEQWSRHTHHTSCDPWISQLLSDQG